MRLLAIATEPAYVAMLRPRKPNATNTETLGHSPSLNPLARTPIAQTARTPVIPPPQRAIRMPPGYPAEAAISARKRARYSSAVSAIESRASVGPNDRRQRRAGTMLAKNNDADRRVRCTPRLGGW